MRILSGYCTDTVQLLYKYCNRLLGLCAIQQYDLRHPGHQAVNSHSSITDAIATAIIQCWPGMLLSTSTSSVPISMIAMLVQTPYAYLPGPPCNTKGFHSILNP